jgi:hypothetical protein
VSFDISFQLLRLERQIPCNIMHLVTGDSVLKTADRRHGSASFCFGQAFILAALWLYLAFNAGEPKDDVTLYGMPLFIVFVGWVLRYFLAGPKV